MNGDWLSHWPKQPRTWQSPRSTGTTKPTPASISRFRTSSFFPATCVNQDCSVGRTHFHPKPFHPNDLHTDLRKFSSNFSCARKHFIPKPFHPKTHSSKHVFIQRHFHPNNTFVQRHLSSKHTFVQIIVVVGRGPDRENVGASKGGGLEAVGVSQNDPREAQTRTLSGIRP